jgi:uncharacterized protein (TIGR02271 family)
MSDERKLGMQHNLHRGECVMNDFFGLFDDEKEDIREREEIRERDERRERTDVVEDGKLRLHQEELDIHKDRVDTGEVILSKEIVEEHKIVDVPVMHEEVVIERRAIDHEPTDEFINAEETIHIPVGEERVEVGKHTVVTGEVSAYKRAVEDTHHVDEVLRREEARVETTGEAHVVHDEEPRYE